MYPNRPSGVNTYDRLDSNGTDDFCVRQLLKSSCLLIDYLKKLTFNSEIYTFDLKGTKSSDCARNKRHKLYFTIIYYLQYITCESSIPHIWHWNKNEWKKSLKWSCPNSPTNKIQHFIMRNWSCPYCCMMISLVPYCSNRGYWYLFAHQYVQQVNNSQNYFSNPQVLPSANRTLGPITNLILKNCKY